MKLIDLNEGITDIVYHYTTAYKAARILQLNKFLLGTSIYNDVEQFLSKDKYYFLSTTRSRKSAISRGFVRDYDFVIAFVLDGRKLSRKYAGQPVSWYYRPKRSNDEDEDEDRIISDTPYIPNATDYIMEMHIYDARFKPFDADIEQEDEEISDHNKAVRFLYKKIKQYKIPTFTYSNPEDFMIMNKRKSVLLKTIQANKGNSNLKDTDYYKQNIKTNINIYYWMDLMTKKRLSSLMGDSLQILGMIKHELKNNDPHDYSIALESLKKAIINEKANHKILQKFTNIMKQNGLRTLNDVLKFINQRWPD